MNYLRRLYCYLYGHDTFTIAMPHQDQTREEVVDYCMRCEWSQQLTHVITD